MADPVPPPSDLPVPYASPWGQLARAARAVLASLRLKLRELWRRNREGDLSVPGFWPQGLAPLFWPLLLAALLALTLALAGQAWRGLSQRAVQPQAGAPESAVLAPAPQEAPAVSAPARVAPPPVAARTPLPEPEPPPPPPPLDLDLELDPLLALLAQDDPDHLIASAHPVPAEGRLVLSMATTYTDLTPASRRRWAERWQQRALALGYERLELLDGRERLLARRALVGSGMILLDPGASG
ncbi:hypothetical protein [Synechococcus sp. BA-132 BA5]|uniref:hypothetical protein n=1 Tax=Synechococcus sp. BA-132 BA5 TaxID=3110252 RepID=UPI002B1FB672|nr:hypothetical protein [Synechococcus sp. BA-132 BA5]MEA5416097.1 hypothetical protein [Synechococcus sp. BA-132 BA5]